MKHPDRTTTYAGTEIVIKHNWLTNEWASQWSIGKRTWFAPGFATSDKALDHAKRIISGAFEPIAKGTN